MVQGSNQCDFLIAVKLSVKIAAQPDALVNCVLLHWVVNSSQRSCFPSEVECFAYSPTASFTIIITTKVIILLSSFGLWLVKTWNLAFTGSFSLSISQVCGLWCYSLNQGAGPVLSPLSCCWWWEFWIRTCCWILVTLANCWASIKRCCQTDLIKVCGNKSSNKYIPKLFFNCYYSGCI